MANDPTQMPYGSTYPSSFLPFLFSLGEVLGDPLVFQSFTGSRGAVALATKPPEVEAKLATSSSWSLLRWEKAVNTTLFCTSLSMLPNIPHGQDGYGHHRGESRHSSPWLLS